jgi:hypothetical protein
VKAFPFMPRITCINEGEGLESLSDFLVEKRMEDYRVLAESCAQLLNDLSAAHREIWWWRAAAFVSVWAGYFIGKAVA